jgi:MbtH protein
VPGNVPDEFVVVVNAEEQYSIWPGFKKVPSGWEILGVRGSKQECIDYINSVWTDMRPRSLREFMRSKAE